MIDPTDVGVEMNEAYCDGFEAGVKSAKPGWISVMKRKPKPVTAQNRRKTEPVLLYSPKGGYYIGWYYGVDGNGNDKYLNRTSRESRQYITTKVTHWMPLPEPPKEGQTDE